MYSKRVLLLIHVILGVSSYLGVSPIRFDIPSKRFHCTVRTRFCCRMMTTLFLVQWVFGTYRLYCLPTLTKESTADEIVEFNIIYITMMCLIIPIICFLLLSIRGDALARSLTQVLRYSKYIESKWCCFSRFQEFRAFPTSLILERLFYLLLATGTLSSFAGGTGVILHRTVASNWISLIPVEHRNTVLVWMDHSWEAYVIAMSGVGIVSVCCVIAFQLGKEMYCEPKYCHNRNYAYYV